jgi:hypothetical protein
MSAIRPPRRQPHLSNRGRPDGPSETIAADRRPGRRLSPLRPAARDARPDIVGTALPEIVGELGGPSWYVWAFTAYLVPATVLLPVAARFSDRLGRQRVLLGGMALFPAGSTVCALAGSMIAFTAGRPVKAPAQPPWRPSPSSS